MPVAISCDRIYESANLATEMINGEKEDYNFYQSLSKMFMTKRDALGDVYFKHLEPINLHEYLQKSAPKEEIPAQIQRSSEATAL